MASAEDSGIYLRPSSRWRMPEIF